VDYIRTECAELAIHLQEYGYLIADLLWVIAPGGVAVYLLHRLSSGFMYSLISESHAVRVMFGTLGFLPNALVLASKILNYSDAPCRPTDGGGTRD
jgi:hypothetical protein